MTRPPVAVLDYGVGNLHSAAKALDRAGADVRVVATVEEAAGAAGLVVPGVGAYGACLTGLSSAGGAAAVAGWLEGGRPLLGICVGMQLLFEASDEGPVADGVGVLPGKIRRLHGGVRGTPGGCPGESGPVKIPHIGWDEVTVRPGSRLLAGLGDGTRFYFVHSYAPEPDGDAVAAVCDYGGRFAAAVEHGNLFGTQFHPEKSGAAGLALLANFVAEVRAA
ncbi:MAG: imidazole glycerol phosphate synthase subunit hisH [Actinomycetia bacterium]|jgi:imidazole glycerol-phosphate synthase subunit HisH|nr:imidazole glycerol phosphate synthase subunit hisH [Actinomycetes bacterium]